MMRRQIAWILVWGASLMIPALASFQPSYATINGGFYDLNAATALPDFNGFDLGIFNVGDSILLGAEMNITGGNVEFSRVGWSVLGETGFVEEPGGFDSVQSGNDRWTLVGASRPNVMSGLGAGTYTLQVYLHGKYNGGADFYASNPPNDYQATFTVIPESSSLILLGLSGLAVGLVSRLRKRV